MQYTPRYLHSRNLRSQVRGAPCLPGANIPSQGREPGSRDFSLWVNTTILGRKWFAYSKIPKRRAKSGVLDRVMSKPAITEYQGGV